jgi:hypothetical protein
VFTIHEDSSGRNISSQIDHKDILPAHFESLRSGHDDTLVAAALRVACKDTILEAAQVYAEQKYAMKERKAEVVARAKAHNEALKERYNEFLDLFDEMEDEAQLKLDSINKKEGTSLTLDTFTARGVPYFDFFETISDTSGNTLSGAASSVSDDAYPPSIISPETEKWIQKQVTIIETLNAALATVGTSGELEAALSKAIDAATKEKAASSSVSYDNIPSPDPALDADEAEILAEILPAHLESELAEIVAQAIESEHARVDSSIDAKTEQELFNRVRDLEKKKSEAETRLRFLASVEKSSRVALDDLAVARSALLPVFAGVAAALGLDVGSEADFQKFLVSPESIRKYARDPLFEKYLAAKAAVVARATPPDGEEAELRARLAVVDVTIPGGAIDFAAVRGQLGERIENLEHEILDTKWLSPSMKNEEAVLSRQVALEIVRTENEVKHEAEAFSAERQRIFESVQKKIRKLTTKEVATPDASGTPSKHKDLSESRFTEPEREAIDIEIERILADALKEYRTSIEGLDHVSAKEKTRYIAELESFLEKTILPDPRSLLQRIYDEKVVTLGTPKEKSDREKRMAHRWQSVLNTKLGAMSVLLNGWKAESNGKIERQAEDEHIRLRIQEQFDAGETRDAVKSSMTTSMSQLTRLVRGVEALSSQEEIEAFMQSRAYRDSGFADGIPLYETLVIQSSGSFERLRAELAEGLTKHLSAEERNYVDQFYGDPDVEKYMVDSLADLRSVIDGMRSVIPPGVHKPSNADSQKIEAFMQSPEYLESTMTLGLPTFKALIESTRGDLKVAVSRITDLLEARYVAADGLYRNMHVEKARAAVLHDPAQVRAAIDLLVMEDHANIQEGQQEVLLLIRSFNDSEVKLTSINAMNEYALLETGVISLPAVSRKIAEAKEGIGYAHGESLKYLEDAVDKASSAFLRASQVPLPGVLSLFGGRVEFGRKEYTKKSQELSDLEQRAKDAQKALDDRKDIIKDLSDFSTIRLPELRSSRARRVAYLSRMEALPKDIFTSLQNDLRPVYDRKPDPKLKDLKARFDALP